MTNDDMVEVETDSIKIIMNPEDEFTLRQIALGYQGPQFLISIGMAADDAVTFTVETGGVPIEDDPMDSYEQIAQVLTMLGDQIQGEVDKSRGK